MFKEIGQMLGDVHIANCHLKAENNELKKLLKVRIEDLCDSCGASSMMPMPCKVYEKTLTEIKEIAEICCKTIDCKKCNFFEICENNCVDVILQKISECEVSNG